MIDQTFTHKQVVSKFLVSDLDGTLTAREAPLSAETADLLISLMDFGWRIVVLTGQHIDNVKIRIVPVLEKLCAQRGTLYLEALQIYTCEGANRWQFDRYGRLERDESFSRMHSFSQNERKQIENFLNDELAVITQKLPIQLSTKPDWWEDAVLVFKLEGDLSLRPQIARELEAQFDKRINAPLRVGTAGKTSMIVAHAHVSKRFVLEEIAGKDPRPDCIVYIGDEFVSPGNDAPTLDVEGIVYINVGQNQSNLPPEVIAAKEIGPEATYHWLEVLLENSEKTRTAKDALRQAIADYLK
jgi:HAD superfamily hydrolase (TIGR01484 family)